MKENPKDSMKRVHYTDSFSGNREYYSTSVTTCKSVISIISPVSLHPVKEPSSDQNTFNWVSKFKFSSQKVTQDHIASPSSSIPTTRTPLLTHIPFRINIKWGERKEAEIFTKRCREAQTPAPSRQAGEGCVQVSVNTFTYPRKARCQEQQCHSQRHRGRSEWLCWLLPWPRGLSLLPSG